MVREGEEDTKKRGWFSRRKKKSATPAARVSRPPSTTSLSFEKKPRSSQSSVVDDQLPPREATSSPIPSVASRPATPGLEPSPATPLPAAAPEDGDVSAAVLPVHAGFNFEAMKEIIGKAEANPAELQVPAPSRFSSQQLHQPTNRSESVPLPSPDSPGATPRFRSSLDARPLAEEEEPVAGPSFYSSMSRSRSVNQIRNEDEDSLTPRFASMSLQSRDTLFSALPASFGSIGRLSCRMLYGPTTNFHLALALNHRWPRHHSQRTDHYQALLILSALPLWKPHSRLVAWTVP